MFRILDCYDSVQCKLLDGGSDVVASWETNCSQCVLYHDSTGRPALSFSERLADVECPSEDGYLFRTVQILEKWQVVAEELFDVAGQDPLWGGRPDIVLERYDEGDSAPTAVFVGEVKYTTDSSYAAQGLRELLEYMAYVHDGEGYVEEQDDVLALKRVTGMLFVDHLDASAERSESGIPFVQFGDQVLKPL